MPGRMGLGLEGMFPKGKFKEKLIVWQEQKEIKDKSHHSLCFVLSGGTHPFIMIGCYFEFSSSDRSVPVLRRTIIRMAVSRNGVPGEPNNLKLLCNVMENYFSRALFSKSRTKVR